jgi:hypothetical protein
VIGSGARWEIDFFLAELPPRLADFAEMPMWRMDRIRTAAAHVQHELADNTDEEAMILLDLAIAAESLCWHPGERAAIDQYVAAQQERAAWLLRSAPDGPESS